MERPRSASRRISSCRRRVSARARAVVGSSMISRFDSEEIALAISTSCCSATESERTMASGSTAMPSRSTAWTPGKALETWRSSQTGADSLTDSAWVLGLAAAAGGQPTLGRARSAAAVALCRLRVQLLGMAQVLLDAVLIDDHAWRLDISAVELAVQAILHHLHSNLTHCKRSRVHRRGYLSRGDRLEGCTGVAIIAVQQQARLAGGLRRLGGAQDLIIVGGKNHLHVGMRLQHVSRRLVTAVRGPVAIETGHDLEIRLALDGIFKTADPLGGVVPGCAFQDANLHVLTADILDHIVAQLVGPDPLLVTNHRHHGRGEVGNV